MKLRNVPLFFALTAFLFSGCEGAQVPLADPDQPIDSSLIGTWDIIDLPEGDDATHMKVIAFNEHEYYVEMWEDGDDADTLRMNVFSTPVDGILFANVRCIDCEDEDEYFFFRYDLDAGGVMTLQGVHENIYTEVLNNFESTKDLYTFFLDNVRDTNFYDDEIARFKRRVD